MHVAEERFSLGQLEFTWDRAKEHSNTRKHGITFQEAATTWIDDHAVELFDEEHSIDEDRWIRIGMSSRGVLVVTVRLERGGTIRIIGARRATPGERSLHETHP